MATKIGIDVSYAQGKIEWSKLVGKIDFAIIRAGYGQGNIDKYFRYNAECCTKYKIPFGVYWFSYATTPELAKKEAKYVLDLVKDYELLYPICYDYESYSEQYASKNGYKLTSVLIKEMAENFLSTIEANGYYAMLYTNKAYYNKCFKSFYGRYDMWVAQWGVSEPFLNCGIWQYKNNGVYDGIGNSVDVNIAYKNYPEIIKVMNNKKKKTEKLYSKEDIKKHITVAKECIKGMHGNGVVRKNKIVNMGLDYSLVQFIIGAVVNE